MAFVNLPSLLVIVELSGSLGGPAVALPHNTGRRLYESIEEIPKSRAAALKTGRIALYLNQPPKDITKGFVFGSDPRSCDVLLATTKETGISANHFSVNVDWVSRDPMITCLSGNAFQFKIIDMKQTTTLSKSKWEGLRSGSTMKILVTGNLRVALVNPTRRDLQAAYDHNLQNYFLEYRNAVPELANISLDDDEITPLILVRGAGLKGKEYFSTGKIVTDQVAYDSKVNLYNVRSKPTPDALEVPPKEGGGYKDVEDWLSNESKGRRPSELYVVKHFRKANTIPTPHQLRQLCHLSHSNLEDVVDLIIEPSVFMVVTATYSHTTLDTQHQNEPLNTEQVGFVMGQIFGALNYLHDRGWVHGDLDPRSIHVMSREPLWVKLTDTALSKHFDLGKPDRYHATYASQKLMQIDKCPGDVWSAGVVALELLSGLPNRSGAAITKQTTWVADLERFAKGCDQKSGTQATAAVRRVLKHDPEARPTAADILGDPWLETTRGALFDVHKSHLNLITSEPSTTFSSRQGSASPIPVFCRNSEPPEPAFTDPPLPTFRSSSAAPSQISPAEALERMTELEKSKDGFYDVDNIDWDKAISFGSSSARSQSVDGGVQTPAMDWKTDGVGRVGGQREVGVPEDSGEETETGRREPVTKKSRKGKAAIPPPLSMKLRSRGKGKAREA